MRVSSTILHICSSVAIINAQVYQGFNYGSTYADGSPITEPGYEALFNAAKNLMGTSGFSSARLFTSIQQGSTNTPSEAFQAAINTKTQLLLGLWGSAGQANIDNELAALQSAIDAHGSEFVDLVVGVSVGSEDLYRISPTGIENESGVGAGPSEIADYISQVRSALGNGGLSGKPIGHTDTWTAYVNASNSAVIEASDFLGMDAYPYFQNTFSNGIENGYSLFFDAYDQTVASAHGKDVWVTETGWPVSGPKENLAEANTDNAKTYWDQVGCGRLFGKINTFWYTLQDAYPNTPSPSFGIVGSGGSTTDVPTTGLFDLSCSSKDSVTPSNSAAPSSSPDASSLPQAVGNNGAQRQNAVEQDDVSEPSSQESPSNEDTKKAAGPAPNSQTSETPVDSPRPKDEHASTSAAPQPSISVTQPSTLITKTSAPSGSPTSGCPAGLTGQFEYPHLIVPVSKEEPDTAQGTSYNGTIALGTSSIFNFDFPSGLDGKTCTLVFLLPKQADLSTSAYELSGTGGIIVERLTEPATEQTTYNHQPAVDKKVGEVPVLEPGNEYVIAGGPCYPAARKGYKLSVMGDLDLNYFQDYNPSPIGLFVTVC